MSALPQPARRAGGVDILYYARDPGAANMIVAARAALEEQAICPLPLQIMAYRLGPTPRDIVLGKTFALDTFAAAGIPASDWSKAVSDSARDLSLRNLLQELSPGLVITGTSDIDDDDDIALWKAAEALEIPTCAIVDTAGNMASRFTDRTGAIVFPKQILVPSPQARRAVIGLGARSRSVSVVGQLHLDRLRAESFFRDCSAANRLRVLWGAGIGDNVLLFASECGREMAAAGRPAPYDEIQALQGLLDTIEHGGVIAGIDTETQPVLVVVRPHPRDAVGKYDAFEAHPKVRITVSSGGSPTEAILASDLVVGMNSMLLHEAKALCRPIHSLTGASI